MPGIDHAVPRCSTARSFSPASSIASRWAHSSGASSSTEPATASSRCSRPSASAAGREHLLEAVAGSVEDEAPDECAHREAMEEAGLKLRAVEHLGTAWSMPGISTEQMDLYLAVYSKADRVGLGGGVADEHEGITVIELPLAELAAMADAGQIVDMKTLAVLQTLRLRKP